MFSDFSLHKALLMALDELKLIEPSAVQQAVIPEALGQVDLRVNAETGSGKTLAFLLPALHRLLTQAGEGEGTRALVLVPTRELAQQICATARALAKHTNLKIGMVVGADHFGEQMKMLEQIPDLLVATPGRLVKHLRLESVNLAYLDVLILDEADRMLDMGFSQDVLEIVDHCNIDRQTMLFSATLSHKGLRGLTEEVMDEPEIITLSTVRDRHSDIRQQIILADSIEHKQKLALWLLQNERFDKALVFTNTRDRANMISAYLANQRVRLGVLHGNMDHSQRQRVMSLLREGVINVLIATDIAARGLDIEGIDLVINFDMARRGDLHVHRIGRTGRAGRKGLAISLIMATEWNLMASIERYLRVRFERRSIKALKGAYNGPRKLKRSGKAAGSKKKKEKKKSKKRSAGAKKNKRR